MLYVVCVCVYSIFCIIYIIQKSVCVYMHVIIYKLLELVLDILSAQMRAIFIIYKQVLKIRRWTYVLGVCMTQHSTML